MNPQTQTEAAAGPGKAPGWNFATRASFCFCLVYFGVFCLTTQVLGGFFPIPRLEIPDLSEFAPVRPLVFWTAAHLFHVTRALVYAGSGSGDKTFDWVLAFCTLVFAAAVTAVWLTVDRKRANHAALYRWFRLFIRFALASQMMVYGMAKAVPLQMPFPFLTRLVEPYGNFSPMGVLWAFVGSSRPYEIFVGCAELLGGILLIFPRTTLLGALVCLIDMTQVFALNMTYDVPVKLFSFHLLLLALFLLAPDLPRLGRFFFLNRTTEASPPSLLFASRRGNHFALAAQVMVGFCLLAANASGAWSNWSVYGGGRPKSELYGIWNVTRISSDGRSMPVSTYNQWRRVIFDFPGTVALQEADDSFVYYSATINAPSGALSVSSRGGSRSSGQFTFQWVGSDGLKLTGNLDGEPMQVQLSLFDRAKFPLIRRGFHWIQEYPVNR